MKEVLLLRLPLFIDDLVLDELLSERVDELSGRFTMVDENYSNVDYFSKHILHERGRFNDDEAQLIHQKSIKFYLFTRILVPFLLRNNYRYYNFLVRGCHVITFPLSATH